MNFDGDLSGSDSESESSVPDSEAEEENNDGLDVEGSTIELDSRARLLLTINGKMEKLNCMQAKVVALLAESLDNQKADPTSKPLRLVVQGTAGTGKSFTIDMCKNITKLKRSSNKAPVFVCAPTGAASFPIGAVTIHSLFHIEVGENSVHYVTGKSNHYIYL